MRAGSMSRKRLVRKLEGRVTVITGASSGVGRAMARAFAEAGSRLGLIARSPEGLEAAASEARELGTEAYVAAFDVADAEAVDDAAYHIASRWGAIDVWINNAMVSVFSPVDQMSPAEFRRVMEVNYLGYVHGTLAALRQMRARDSGVIVQVGSALAYRSIPLQSAYCASKAAVRGFTDSLRSELIHSRSRIKLTMLQLPAVNTPQFEVVRSRLPKHPQPVPPIYQPELIAKAAVDVVLRPRREVWIGWGSVKAILGQRVIPGLLDHYLAAKAWGGQQTDQLPSGHPGKHRRDNVDSPIPGDPGAHGPFDFKAKSFSLMIWSQMHRRWLAMTAGIAIALALGPVVRSFNRDA